MIEALISPGCVCVFLLLLAGVLRKRAWWRTICLVSAVLVLVVSGKDKGAKGKVLQAYPTRNKILVEGVNRIKKHTPVSRTERGASSGGIVTQEAPIHVSNVMVVDSDGKPTRIGYRKDDESGKNVRIAKTNGKDI